MARIKIPRSLQVAIFHRDHWHCRYCLEPVFFNPTLKLLEQMSPGHGYYHAHSKSGAKLSLFQRRFATADHIVPVANGGENSAENLVTACWECNLDKRDRNPNEFTIRDVPAIVVAVNWDGLSSIYAKLPGAKQEWIGIIRNHQCQ